MRIIVEESGVEYRIAADRRIRTPEDAANTAAEWGKSETECFCVLCLDAKNGMRAAEIISSGILDSALIHPREVFRPAIIRNAKAIVLLHNHPSGDPAPSAEDIRITKQIKEAGKVLEIDVLDHVIVAWNGSRLDFCSMRESGVMF